ncbi:MAG: RluA family pseudouridine synthase [Fimbriiglobus sp.]
MIPLADASCSFVVVPYTGSMVPKQLPAFAVIAPEAGHTLAKVLRSRLHESRPSWKEVRAVIEARRVSVAGEICTDEARRLEEGEMVELLANPKMLPKEAHPERLVLRHVDEHLVVVEKPAGLNTVRHPSELEWSEERRRKVPTLQDLTQFAIARKQNRKPATLTPLRIVHRLDRETSGLLVFARSAIGERELGLQFRKHTVVRRYITIVPGVFSPQMITSHLVPDRGDGRRGSTTLPDVGKKATTHVFFEERLNGYSLLSCRLETGRTHQIRIHLSEAGHPICGDRVYCKRFNKPDITDNSGAERLALHAVELGFVHPTTGVKMHWDMPLPPDMQKLLDRLRGTTS